MNTFVPNGSSVSINCSVIEYEYPFWAIMLHNKSEVIFSQDPRVEAQFHREGIFKERDSSDFLRLHINRTHDKNGTVVTCYHSPELGSKSLISETVLIVLGKYALTCMHDNLLYNPCH